MRGCIVMLVALLLVLAVGAQAQELNYIRVGGDPQVPGGLPDDWCESNDCEWMVFDHDVEIYTQSGSGVLYHGLLEAGKYKVAVRVDQETDEYIVYRILTVQKCGNYCFNTFVTVAKPKPATIVVERKPPPPQPVVPIEEPEPVVVVIEEPEVKSGITHNCYLSAAWVTSEPGYDHLYEGLSCQHHLSQNVALLTEFSTSQSRDRFWGSYSLHGERIRGMVGLQFKNDTERFQLYLRVGKEYDYEIDEWLTGEIYQADVQFGNSSFWNETILAYRSDRSKAVWLRERLKKTLVERPKWALGLGGEYKQSWWQQPPHGDEYFYVTHLGVYLDLDLYWIRGHQMNVKAGGGDRSESPHEYYFLEFGIKLW
ncbi:MAG: hypothetical protein ABIB97_01565 [Patescibacteria group bacterium]